MRSPIAIANILHANVVTPLRTFLHCNLLAVFVQVLLLTVSFWYGVLLWCRKGEIENLYAEVAYGGLGGVGYQQDAGMRQFQPAGMQPNGNMMFQPAGVQLGDPLMAQQRPPATAPAYSYA